MGCYPLGKKVSEAFGNCSGRERKSSSRAAKTYLYSRPKTVIKSVNFSNDTPIVIIPPDPNTPKPRPAETPTHHPINSTTATVERSHVVSSPPKGTVKKEAAAPVQRSPPHCYVMSPLPRWEERPRRREYFSGEYNYYPTPIREGIYNIGTDPTLLTSMFSEENPNACTIV